MEQLRILLIAGNPIVVDEISGYLHAEFRNPAVRSVASVEALEASPPESGWHLCIFCDEGLEAYPEVLIRLRSCQPGCPILLVLDLEDEARASDALRIGVSDYILKTPGYGDRLRAAASAMVRSAAETSEAGYRDNLQALQSRAKQFQELVENAAAGILIHVDETPVYANTALIRMLGYQNREDVLSLASIYELVDARDRQRVLRFSRRFSAGIGVSDTDVFRARRSDGGLIWLENRVNTVTWQGRPAVQCTMVDVSDRRRAHNALRLTARVAAKAGEQDDFEEAIRVVLHRLARGMGWELAESWLPSDANDALAPGPVWCNDRKRFDGFIRGSRRQRFRPGEGLVGRVWETGYPEWIEDVCDAHMLFRRSILANDAGLRTGCSIPIIARGRTVAVLCFYMTASLGYNRELVTALGAAAASLGPVLLQIQSEQARRASIAQTESLITGNLDGILVVDDQDRILFANPAALDAFGRSIETLRNMPFGTPSLDKDVAEIEVQNVRTGETRMNEMRITDIEWDGRGARLISLRDVTERFETQRTLEQHRQALQERVKELRCVYAVSEHLARTEGEWRDTLQRIVDAVPSGWRYPGSTCAKLQVEDVEVVSSGFRAAGKHLSSDVVAGGRVIGRLVVYCDESQVAGEGDPFLKEERNLIDDLTRRIGQSISTRRYQQELDTSRRRFRDFAEAASDWLWEMDENLRFTYFSDRIQVVMGQTADHWMGKTRRELTVEQNVAGDPKWVEHIADLEAHRPFRNFRYEIALPDGTSRHVVISGMPVFDEAGEFRGYRGTGTDETNQLVAQNLARELDHRLKGVADGLPGIVFQRLRKPDGRIEYPFLSAAITSLFGFEVEEVQNDPQLWASSIHPEDRSRFEAALAESGRTIQPMDLKLRSVTRSGGERWFWHRSTPHQLPNGDMLWDCIELDVTDQKKAEDQVKYLGYHDQLTGLPNRELFLERIGQILPIASRNTQSIAVAMLGLKRFKQVNEEFGMSGGDEVLRTAAARFSGCLRPGDTVARLGGDRFLFLLPSVGLDPDTHKPLDKLVESMEKPFTVSQNAIMLTFNMGVAVYPEDGDGAEELIQKADTAQAHLHSWGPGSGYTFFRDRMPASETPRLALEKELRDAIDSGEQIRAFYQPIYDVVTGRLIGVETLARWMHPQRGLVPPVEFIPLAEDTGLINPLGLWILRQACIDARAWENAGLPRVVVTVNVSAKQIRDPALAQSIKEILRDTGMAPHRLLLEVTESTLIADLDRGSKFMEELVAEGVYFALDDFGVGYSSLSYLGRLPVHTLKIDRSFVSGLQKDARSESTVKAIVALAHALELHVVAEGVELREQLESAIRLGCDTVQGFLLARPMPAAELAALLDKRQSMGEVLG
ncbi:MAG: EAL domain-containing protein [Gammaproteobacteria bacterium]|nr:EAL domain-containing protein [Gammaproteobacteria bacterium]